MSSASVNRRGGADPYDVECLRELARRDLTGFEMARSMGCSVNVVSTRARANGVDIVNASGWRNSDKPPLVQVLPGLAAEGLSRLEISKRAGWDFHHVSKRTKAMGVEIVRRRPRYETFATDEEFPKMGRMA